MENPPLHNLPRLERSHYQSFAAVHWTMCVEPKAVGWLNHGFHSEFRELLAHGCARESLVCPAYCLMPDHLHLMLLGAEINSDQLNAIKFLRLHMNRLLSGKPLVNLPSPAKELPWNLQPQSFDHVLREEERKRHAFARVCFYILANPVRSSLVTRENDWPYLGCVVPGYPDLQPFQEDYWELFWKLYYKMKED